MDYSIGELATIVTVVGVRPCPTLAVRILQIEYPGVGE